MNVELTVNASDAGKRIDAYLAEQVVDMSRTLAHTLLEDGHILAEGRKVKPSHRVVAGEHIAGSVIHSPAISAAPENITLDVVYQDADLAIINKPAGMVVHPAAGHPGGTMANALTALFPQSRAVGDSERPGIVHRLDKDTSGLLVVALSALALSSLQRQIAERTVRRQYIALASGKVEPAEATIDAPIGRDPKNRQRMAVHGIAARHARTSYRVKESFSEVSLLEVTLDTGRTHQIRVHLAAIGHPLAGDSAYDGPTIEGLKRQFLHAARLSVMSPSTRNVMEFEAPLPPDLAEVLNRIRARTSQSG